MYCQKSVLFWSLCATSRMYLKIYLRHLLLNSEYFSRCSFSQNVLVSLDCMVACIPLLSLACTASTAGQNTCKTQQKWKKSLANCTDTWLHKSCNRVTCWKCSSKRAISFCGHWNQYRGWWVQWTYEYVSLNSRSINLKQGKIFNFETNFRSYLLFNVSDWKQLARWTLDENCIFVSIASLTRWKWKLNDVHNKTAPTLLVTVTVQTV